jgi:NTP pyrophosphatase (non-canonical NTP hydrolase)
MFDQNYKVRNHATVTLKLDSKITILIVRLNHLCATQNGVPLEEIAQILLPQLKAKGKQVLMEDLINLGHFEEEAEKLIAYVRFAENNLNRKLEFDLITKTIKDSKAFIKRFVKVFKKIGQVESEQVMSESKVLISDIEKFLKTDAYLVLAGKENAEIPHSRYITGDSDAM